MGDRCYSVLTVLAEHRSIFENLGYQEDEAAAEGSPALYMRDQHADYGNWSELQALAKRNVPFTGQNGAGEGYGPIVFASDGAGTWAEAPCDEAGLPTVSVRSDLTLEGLRTAVEYWRVLKLADIKLNPPTPDCGCTTVKDVGDAPQCASAADKVDWKSEVKSI